MSDEISALKGELTDIRRRFEQLTEDQEKLSVKSELLLAWIRALSILGTDEATKIAHDMMGIEHD